MCVLHWTPPPFPLEEAREKGGGGMCVADVVCGVDYGISIGRSEDFASMTNCLTDMARESSGWGVQRHGVHQGGASISWGGHPNQSATKRS